MLSAWHRFRKNRFISEAQSKVTDVGKREDWFFILKDVWVGRVLIGILLNSNRWEVLLLVFVFADDRPQLVHLWPQRQLPLLQRMEPQEAGWDLERRGRPRKVLKSPESLVNWRFLCSCRSLNWCTGCYFPSDRSSARFLLQTCILQQSCQLTSLKLEKSILSQVKFDWLHSTVQSKLSSHILTVVVWAYGVVTGETCAP